MRCWACRELTDTNKLMGENSEEDSDKVTNYFGLIHINGPADCFMPDDGSMYASLVIICSKCWQEALDDE